MEKLYAKLIKKNYRHRYYRLSKPIYYGWLDGEKTPIEKAPSEGIDIICISDANTHTERLVFPAHIKDGEPKILDYLQIDGKMTFMIYGGDDESIYNDYTYIKHLAILNGYDFHFSHFESSEANYV